MALTLSNMLELGTPAPDFALRDVSGRVVRRDDFAAAPALVVAFICNHCPYVKHVQGELVRLGREYGERGVAWVAINSNDSALVPEDGYEVMCRESMRMGYPFPYLHDASQEVARAYRAACTPEFYLFDAGRRLVYRGQMDDSRPGNGIPVSGADLRRALDCVLGGHPVPADQRPGMGCNIKWRS